MSTSSPQSVDGTALAVKIRRRVIVHHVDIQLPATGVLGLLGPNGAGKTTLMRALSTAVPISGGELRLLGHDVGRDHSALRHVRKRIGYAPQLPLVLRHLSTFDQVAYAAWLKGLNGHACEVEAERALEDVDLGSKAKAKTRQLSGGMLRRLGIAMALVASPQLLLLDEPTAGLDPEQRLRFRDLVTSLGRERAVILSTHLVEDVASLCSQVTVMSGGRSIFAGSPAALAARGEQAEEGPAGIASGFAAVTGMKS